ncbi:hypothetical protein ACR03S_00045 [Limimaricola variabilis]
MTTPSDAPKTPESDAAPTETSPVTPETGSRATTAGTDAKAEPGKTAETGTAASTAAGKDASEEAPKSTKRGASAGVDLGTTARPAPASTAGAMPAVTRAPRADADAKPEAKPASSTASTASTASTTPPSTAPAASSGSGATGRGFGAGMLGGLIAAALGLGIGWIWFDNSDRTAALETRLGALEGEIAPLSDGIEGLRAETETNLSDLGTRLDAGQAELSERLDTLETRLTEAEASAGPDGTLAREAVARWQAEVDALRADLERQAQEIARMAEEAAQEVASVGRTAEEIEAEAAAVAARARARATLAEIEAALETGEPYTALLEELQATSPAEIPDALTAPAEEGVASRSELIEAFPEPARLSLATARREGLSGEEGGRVAGFFRDTLQLRSTAPQEGTTTDAVLSRAEAALRDGRLDEAIAEIEALPDPVQEPLAEWLAPARTRAEALAAADTLSQSLTEN